MELIETGVVIICLNRYEGEKEVETKTGNKQLSELLKRIEERKKERVIEKEIVQDVKEDDRKRKKRKVEVSKQDPLENTSINEDASQNNVETQLVHPEKLHKKKKKKKKNVDDLENNVNYEGTEGDNKELQEVVTNDEKNMLLNKSADVNNVQEQSDFMVLGVKNKRKKYEVKRVLPEWLANPNIISNDLNDGPSLESLNSVLDAKLIQVLKANGINKLFPVQASMITWLLKCNEDKQKGWWLRDTCVSAPTGSGTSIQNSDVQRSFEFLVLDVSSL